nr:endogenous retrovirus group K member 8 Env polyprotein-like isoform X2 [Panthera onca]
MKSRRAGSRFGSSETLRLRRKMAKVTATEPPQKRQRRSHKAGTATWGQIKNLLTQATDVAMASGGEVAATHVFLACAFSLHPGICPLLGIREYYVSPVLQLRACAPPPYSLVVGDGTITPAKEDGHQLYRLTCPACALTNCLPVDGPSRSGMKVYLLLPPPYWMLPVHVTGPWYPNYGMQLALEISERLRKTRRFLGLLIAGPIAAVTVIPSATVSVISLHESAQTASHVNELAHNVSKALATQERIDRKLEAQLEALQEALMYLGDQFAILRTRLSLICHDAYKHICVTPLEDTNRTWGQVRRHLQGVWHDANTSLDLSQLQEEINAVAGSSLSFPDPGDLAETILHQLNGFNPFNILQHSFWIFIGIVSVISVILVLLCYFWRWGLTAFTTYQPRMHMLQLQTKGGHVGGRAPAPG